MSHIAIVTDSTAYLSPELIDRWQVRVVPVEVIVGGRGYREGVDITPAEVAAGLREWKMITTSRPSPADFTKTYLDAAAAGATGVVSIHLSSAISGTYESAMLGARESEIPVTVVDSRSIAMGLGFAVIAAARAAAEGADMDAVVAAAERVAAESVVLFYVDTLEFLRRGGRVGATAAVVGTALRVKPLLTVTDGTVTQLEKARTANKALARLADIAVERAAGRNVQVAVQHLEAPERADQLAAVLQERLATKVSVSEVGAVVGAHVGPGMVSVSLAPAE